jgi:hypothetical protein
MVSAECKNLESNSLQNSALYLLLNSLLQDI